MRRGGRQGIVEMPQFWDICLGHVLRANTAGWPRNGWGVEIPSTAVDQSGCPATKRPPLQKVEVRRYLNHVVWADQIMCVVASIATLQSMVDDLTPAPTAAKLEIKWDKGEHVEHEQN